MKAWMAALLAALLAALPAAAQTPPRAKPEERYEQDLAELSRVLGGAHYLRILCAGRGDQGWRETMRKFLDMEGPPGTPRRTRMVAEFNDGYRALEERFPACGEPAKAEEARLKTQGARLSSGLAARYRD